ncbi:unnamed protein product [Enterobius vermicularis]|uniref:FH2 domain-containing protein n=1 Tax=Enterobius vermicularis TaxID=51028 RepID=A0A0N4V3Q7_ENTVE|nr:unnamed protein product [Enterobius vermicularis]
MLANGGTMAATASGAGVSSVLNLRNGTADLAALLAASSSGTASADGNLPAASGSLNPLANMNDAAALIGLSQLFAAQHHQSLVQQFHAAAQQQQQNAQQQLIHDKKRSYPCTFQFCVLCQKNVHSSKLPCHIRQCHVAKPMFQCPACDFTSTYSKNNVKSHMVSLHGLAGDPISYMEQYAGQVEEYMKKCFPHVRGRGRPIHGGGRVSPSSPSSPQSVESNGSRRGSFGSNNSSNTTSQRQYTHSQRRMSAKQAAQQISLHEQLMAFAKASQAQNLGSENSATAAARAFQGFDPATLLSVSRPSATADIKTGVALKFEPSDTSLNNDMDTSVSSSANVVDEPVPSISTASSNNGSNGTFDVTSPVNECKSSPEIENIHRFRPGETLQPRWELDWEVLTDEQTAQTVFDTFNTQSILEKLDLTLFEPLLEDSTFLSEEKLQKIADVRQRIHLQTFEIMFAVHRLDLAVLSAENVDLVASIAPSAVDILRFKNYEMSNSTSTLGEDEQFILQLSKIERMEEKLRAMSHMSHFSSRINKLNEQINDLMAAAKLLQNSSEFHNIVQLLLTYGNFVSGDFNAQLVKGFRTSCLLELSMFKFPTMPETTLLNVVAETISKHFPELAKFGEQIPIIEKAAKANFMSIASTIRELETGHSRVLTEMQHGGTIQLVADFIETAEPLLCDIKDAYNTVKNKLTSTLHYFGEPIPYEEIELFQPEEFFSKIAGFCRSLQKALVDLHL